ncbi:hypothetical protein EDB83DRAFT_2674706 [Lactarius deliciosus]|nr:hypothetical protein EDB83DRAFT_2674706 [Lactarius deliciosus]
MLRPPTPGDEDTIMAALEQSDRVYSIGLTISKSLLKKLSTISEPFLGLEELSLLSKDNVPSQRFLLLSPSQNLVDLQVDEIPGVGCVSSEAFANALCRMTRLETLSLHFLSFLPRRKHVGLPPPSGDLPALTRFKCRGISKYLDSLVARIDAPRLGDIDVTFFNQPTLDASQLGLLFVDRIETRVSPLRADIVSSVDAISISITQPRVLRTWLDCKYHDLGIETTGPSSVPGDMDDEQWLRLIRAFGGVKVFRLAGELSTDVLRALHPVDEGYEILLPALQYLYVQGPWFMHGPSRNSVESFLAQRQLSNHPVQVYYDSAQQQQQLAQAQQNQQRAMLEMQRALSGGLGAGEGSGGLMSAGAVTMDMFQSFMHRNGEGGQGQ